MLSLFTSLEAANVICLAFNTDAWLYAEMNGFVKKILIDFQKIAFIAYHDT